MQVPEEDTAVNRPGTAEFILRKAGRLDCLAAFQQGLPSLDRQPKCAQNMLQPASL